MPLSSHAKDKLLDMLLGESVYVSLHTADPGTDGAHELKATASATGYTRQAGAGRFGRAGDGERKITEDLYFKELPEAGVTHIGLWDSANGGHFLWSAELVAKKTIFDGDTLLFPAGHVLFGLS